VSNWYDRAPFVSTVEQPVFRENSFIRMKPENKAVPTFASARPVLPFPFWDGHEDAIRCWWRVWELAFRNVKAPTPQNGFVARYIDTAFNNNLFMWDSAFILMFARYGKRAFDFQRTLDNMYRKQHPDGFICREIRESDGIDCWGEWDPSATGPNVMPWTEWEYFKSYGDRERLAAVFPPLAAFNRWMMNWRRWPDGTYWANGLSCGMDNQPRIDPSLDQGRNHGHLSWIDTCLQQAFVSGILFGMAKVLGREREFPDFAREARDLGKFANTQMWNAKDSFYYDRAHTGRLTGVPSIGAYWALIAGIVPEPRLGRFIGHLSDPKWFNRPHRVPTLAACHPQYHADGGYWMGAVWPCTNYMVLRGLTLAGEDSLAHEIALNHHANVVEVFGKTGTVFENYAPESAAPGRPAKADFVGWGGLGPTAVFLEYVLGLRPDMPRKRLMWDIRLLEEHGVKRYPWGRNGVLDLSCAPRRRATEKPVVKASSNAALELEIHWQGGKEVRKLRP